MDDGSIKDFSSGACILNTQSFNSFTLQECYTLISALRDRYGLQSKIRDLRRIHKLLGHQIYVSSNNNRLLDLVQPYYLECMQYKLPKRVRASTGAEGRKQGKGQ